MMMMHRHWLLLVVLMVLSGADPAEAARPADAGNRRALSAAAASWSGTDSLALDGAGSLIEQTVYGRKRLTRRGLWISSLDRRWARVIVRTTRDDRISTVLRRSGGRWRAVASGGFGGPDGNRRDGAQCRRSGIPRLVAVDLALGTYDAFDPAGRCQGPDSRRRRAMTAGELEAAVPTAISPDWAGPRDDFGDCVAQPSQGTAAKGFVSRTMPAWSFVQVYCTQGGVFGQAQLGRFAAVLHNGRPVERLNVSENLRGDRCWSGRELPEMPIRARLELGVCTPMPFELLDSAR